MAMSKSKRNQLEGILCRWAAGREPTSGQLAELQDRVLRRWSEEPMVWARQGLAASHATAAPSARRFRLAAAAASVLLVIVVGWLAVFSGGRDASSDQREEVGVAVAAGFETERTAALQSVFAEVDRLFDGQLAWVAETAEQVLLGLTEDHGAATGRPRVVVRLAIMRRAAAAKDWVPVWWVDVLCRPEEVVRVSHDGQLGDLYLWAYLLADGMVAVDTELSVEGPVQIRAARSDLYQRGVPKILLVRSHNGVEYRVLQTVAVLDSRGGRTG